MRKWWPGPITLILPSRSGGTVGVRVPGHKVALDLLRHAGPLMTTSANLHGREPAMNAEEAAALSGVMAVGDGGAATGGVASTRLDLAGPGTPRLRGGGITTAQ